MFNRSAEWHWSSYTLADRSARRARPQRHTESRHEISWSHGRRDRAVDLPSPIPERRSSPHTRLDHLGASELADDFKQLLATTPPDVLADERAAMRIPDDYVLQTTDRRTPAARRPPRPPRRVRMNASTISAPIDLRHRIHTISPAAHPNEDTRWASNVSPTTLPAQRPCVQDLPVRAGHVLAGVRDRAPQTFRFASSGGG